MESGEWGVVNKECRMQNAEWRVGSGEWGVECAECRMDNEEWGMKSGEWRE